MKLYSVGKILLKIIAFFLYNIDTEYAEDISENQGLILASNHIKDLDPVILGLTFKKQIRFMAKSELFKIPILGFLIKHLGAFPVQRGKGDHGAIDRAIEVVQNGGVFGIFPEGGRSKDGKLKRAKSGVTIVASQTGADILPAAISYEKRKWFRRRRITVKYGMIIKNEMLGISDIGNHSELRNANKIVMQSIADLLGVEAP